MYKLLPILLLFLSCEEPADCAGVSGGLASEDECGMCTGGTTDKVANYLQDCEGICGGDAELDDCGVCNGGNISGCADCTGELHGNNICGCTDNAATNFNSEATYDDGSCIILFVETFGDSDNDVGYAIQPTVDGGYIVVGSSLIKIDIYGNKEWDKASDGKSIHQTADGGYIITRNYSGFTPLPHQISQGFLLIKKDSNGNSEWSKTLHEGNNICWSNSVKQTLDGGYIIVGWYHFNQVGGMDIAITIKTNSEGNEEWYETGSGANFNSIQQTTDSGYIITGCSRPYAAGTPLASSSKVLLVKKDPQGADEWYKLFDEYSCGHSVQQTTDGGYIIGSGKNLIKTDSDGNQEWNKSIGSGNGYSVQQTTDGGYIIAGKTESYGNGGEDIWLIKTNSLGSKEWDKAFGGSDDDVGYSVHQTTDGGYIIAGKTESYGNGGEDIWLIKTDSFGNTVPKSEWE